MGWLSLLPLTGLWFIMVNRKLEQERAERIRIKLEDIPEGISNHNKYLIKRQNNVFVVLSTNCTHLGCRLKITDDNQLTCPCHGSAFNPENGIPLRGPAIKRLEMLNFTKNEDYLEIEIR
jgi:Rieske Fe-S protein